jgi:Ca2+-binding RTX toxin-like protein
VPLWNPTFNGDSIFGLAVRMAHVAAATDQQITSFFGQGGQLSMFGGKRGRTFMVVGCFVADDVSGLNDAEAIFQSYADGFAYELVDTRGRTWQQVQFRGELQLSEVGPCPRVDTPGWGISYKAVLHGLI